MITKLKTQCTNETMCQYANEEIKAKEQAKAKKVKSLRSKVIGRETYRQCDNMPICQCANARA